MNYTIPDNLTYRESTSPSTVASTSQDTTKVSQKQYEEWMRMYQEFQESEKMIDEPKIRYEFSQLKSSLSIYQVKNDFIYLLGKVEALLIECQNLKEFEGKSELILALSFFKSKVFKKFQEAPIKFESPDKDLYEKFRKFSNPEWQTNPCY
jgi:hypothetical protein